MKIETIQIEKLLPDPTNARKHDKRNIDEIAASIATYGVQSPIVIDANNVVLKGNGTIEALKALGETTAPCVRSELKGADARMYAIADNRTAELAEWNNDVLGATLQTLRDDDAIDEIVTGFSDGEIDAIIAEFDPPASVEEDEVPEPPKDPITKAGDLWLLGDHRLLCGDCREPKDLDRLMDRAKVNIGFTSPPYASQREYDTSTSFRPIKTDDYVDWFASVQSGVKRYLSNDGSWFINIKPAAEKLDTSLYVLDLVVAHVRDWGWHFATEFCWERSGLPKQVKRRFKNQFEPVYQFAMNDWKIRPESVMKYSSSVPIPIGEGDGDTNAAKRQGVENALKDNEFAAGMAYPGNRLPTYQSEMNGHPAAFPVGLPSFFINGYTDESDIVYDPFLGSGTTLIAAEQLNRKCYGIEISPAYCDIIIKRWENLTGETAHLETKGVETLP